MSEHFKHKTPSVTPHIEPDVAVLLKRMQEQLVSLERKIDSLLNQSQPRTFNKDRSFSKPFRPSHHSSSSSGYSSRPSSGPREHGVSRDRSFDAPRPERRSSDDSRGFSPKKKPFFNKSKSHR